MGKIRSLVKATSRVLLSLVLFIEINFLSFTSFAKENVQTTRLGIAMGFMVHEICSCIFIETRSFAECEADYVIKSVPVNIDVDATAKVVKAKFRFPSNENYVYARTAKFSNSSCILSAY
jgi:hypothetical protein